jgi:SET domain-containing protein
MPEISPNKPYRIGRSKTGLGLFATKKIKKGAKIIRYMGPMLDSKNEKHDGIDNKYLFEINNRWTIDGSTRKNVARYINHSCKPNAESDVNVRKRKVIIRAIKTIEPGEEILKPIGCKCDSCEKKRKKKRTEERAEKLRLKLKAEKKAQKLAEEAKTAKAKTAKARKVTSKATKAGVANAHARGAGKPTKTKASRTGPVTSRQSKTSSRVAR